MKGPLNQKVVQNTESYRGALTNAMIKVYIFFDLDNPSSLPNLSRPVSELTHTSISHLPMKKLVWHTQLDNISLPGSRSHLKRSHRDMKAFFFSLYPTPLMFARSVDPLMVVNELETIQVLG